MKHFKLIICYLIAATSVFAQDRLDMLSISGKYTTPSSYDSVYSGNAQESGAMVSLAVPFPISEKTTVYTGLTYMCFHVNNEEALSSDLADPISLYGYILNAGVIQEFSEGRSLQFLFAPRWMTDGKGDGSGNLQLGFTAVYNKVHSEKLTLGFGAVYNQEFYGPFVIPVINLLWQPSDKFSISGMLPINYKISYNVNKRVTTGISFLALTNSFRLHETAYADDYMQRISNDLGLFARCQVWGNIFMEARVGESLMRSYRQYESDDKVNFALPLVFFNDERTQKNVDFKDGLFAELKLVYSIPLTENE